MSKRIPLLGPGLNEYRYRIINDWYGNMAFINLTPHKLVMYATEPDDKEDLPIWTVPPSGCTVEASVDTAAQSTSQWATITDEGVFTATISALPPYTGLRFKGKLTHLPDEVVIDLSSAEWLRGRAVFCSNISAEILGDFAKYGVHCFVPSNDMTAIVRDATGRVVGTRAICNATRYPPTK